MFIDNENVTRINGNLTLQDDKNVTYKLKDVKFLIINNQTMQYLPNGFGAQFPNLEGLQINGSRLQILTHDNLKEFPYLQYLDVENNEIER